MTEQLAPESIIYQGQFGNFTIERSDRTGVIIYRIGLAISAISFALGSAIALTNTNYISLLTPLFFCFSLGLGISLLTIHIYLAVLHRVLQIFWAIGTTAAVFWTISSNSPLAITLYRQPVALFSVGFIFAALTGIFFKEAFCFQRLETKFLTFLIPVLLLGHMLGIFPPQLEQSALTSWAILFAVFALRKALQPIPPDIGDKSVFTYLHERKA
ncbi:MAG: DUF2301 domain-containing membrane protein [Chroococcus sp. CMT-3BRIN-NPC107]|jgi:uncharacterized integral membrane protein|nr:DUF2301 domain-containing membrane protein [Chroococcus sp. CMT-3BRIN-NPC107]